MKTLRNTVYTLSLTLLFGCGIDNQKNMHSEDGIQAGSLKKDLLTSRYRMEQRKGLLLSGYIRRLEQESKTQMPEDLYHLANKYFPTSSINDDDFYPLIKYITGYGTSESSYQEITDQKTLDHAKWICRFYTSKWYEDEAKYCTKVGYDKALSSNPKYEYEYEYDSDDFISVVKRLIKKDSNDRQQQDFLPKNDTTYTYQDHIKYVPKALDFIQGAVEEYVETRNNIMHAMEEYAILDKLYKTNEYINECLDKARSPRFENLNIDGYPLCPNPLKNLLNLRRLDELKQPNFAVAATDSQEDMALYIETKNQLANAIKDFLNSISKFIEELKSIPQEWRDLYDCVVDKNQPRDIIDGSLLKSNEEFRKACNDKSFTILCANLLAAHANICGPQNTNPTQAK